MEMEMETEARVPSLEYRGGDGAWYDVSVKLQVDHGRTVLSIHYEGFPDLSDEQIAVEGLLNVQEIKDKLRLSSKQLKDKYCRKVTNGLTVCASSDWQDTKFFDALVHQVSWFKHMLVNDEEQCMCKYKVLWLAGPFVGERTTIHCENIRLLQFGSIQRHPVVKEFLQMIQENMDRRSQSSGRNPLRKRAANLEDRLSEPNNPNLDSVMTGEEEQSINQCDDGCSEDIFLMSDKQRELGRETNEDVGNCNSRSNSLASKDGRSRTLGELCDQRRCEVPVVNGDAFTRCGGKHFKGDDLSLMIKEEKDCLPDLNAVPNHSQLFQQFIATNAEGIVNVLSQCKEVKDADAHISVEDCFIPGERSTKEHATTGSFSMPGTVINIDHKDLGKLSSSVEFPASMIPSFGLRIDGESPDIFSKSINGEKEGKNNVEIADETGYLSLNQHCLTANGHDIKQNLSFVIIENENGDFESSGDRGRQDVATQKHRKIQEITPINVTVNECTASSWGRNKRSKHNRDNEMFDSVSYVRNHKHIVECRQGLGRFKSPVKDSVEIDALSSDHLKASYLEYHKKKEREHDHCEFVGMMARKVEKSGNGVQVSMWDQQIKQPFCKETQSVEDFSEAVNMLYGNGHGDTVQNNGSIHEHKRSCRSSESDIQLQRSSCATIEPEDILFSNDQCKAVQGNGCWGKEDLQKRASKCRVCKHTPFMQSQDACHSDLELHNCCMEFSSSSFYSDALCRASLRDSCEDHDRFHYRSSCELNCSSCSCAIHSRASELHSKSRWCQNYNQNVHGACSSNSISAGPCHKGRNRTKAQYEYSATCTMRECFKDQTRVCRGPLGLDGDTFFCNGQSKHCGWHSLHCKEYNTCSFHCLQDGNRCVVSSEGESIDIEGTKELREYGNCNLCAHRSSKSSRKLHASGKTFIVEEVRYNSMQRAVREIYLDTEFGHDVKEDLKAEGRIFPSSQVLLLENLEKDVTPLDVLGVIHQATCGLVQVCISPSSMLEQFTRGFVCFEDRLSLQDALDYLQDEDIFIASSNGRPWVVLSVENGLYDGVHGDFTIGSKIVRPCGTMLSNKIKIYRKGTPGYEKAKLLKGIFLELREHTMLLHRRLEHEESQI